MLRFLLSSAWHKALSKTKKERQLPLYDTFTELFGFVLVFVLVFIVIIEYSCPSATVFFTDIS